MADVSARQIPQFGRHGPLARRETAPRHLLRVPSILLYGLRPGLEASDTAGGFEPAREDGATQRLAVMQLLRAYVDTASVATTTLLVRGHMPPYDKRWGPTRGLRIQ